MTYVVTRLCRDCVDTACAQVCPVKCFYIPKQPTAERPLQLYISPDECIDCDACVPECPWEAIYKDENTPPIFADDVELNAKCDAERSAFDTAPDEDKPQPEATQIAENKRKWGLEE